MDKEYYKGYYLMTSRCNLACSYCVLENKPLQLKEELDLPDKKQLISHLYQNLGFRSLTISGGEALLIGKKAPDEFLELLAFLKQFKSKDAKHNLKLYLYSNTLLMTNKIAEAMKGIIDGVSITIDSYSNDTLRNIGRNRGRENNYLEKVISACKELSRVDIPITIHTVVSKMNCDNIVKELPEIILKLQNENISVHKWKFYQYMSYDVTEVDNKHTISRQLFKEIKSQAIELLNQHGIFFHFKDTTEMKESLFNILPYGNVQYNAGGSWSTTKRSSNLMQYNSVEELFNQEACFLDAFKKYHKLHI
jgi:sulfatase maturation enzyme AslB (radical SAM superfamily)